MLDIKTGKYASSGLPVSDDRDGNYFPDSSIDALVKATREGMPSLFAHDAVLLSPYTPSPVIKDPDIPYDKSRELVIAALKAFDPGLGEKAEQIFKEGFDKAIGKNSIEVTKDLDKNATETSIEKNDLRWRIHKVEPGETRIMRSLPANSAATEFNPANPNPHAVIQFQYDNTINSLIFLAHEVGHSIADDYIRDKNGVKKGDNPAYLDEFQAYFVQHIMYDYLRKSGDPALAKAAEQHFATGMLLNIHQIPAAVNALEAQKAGEHNKQTDEAIGRLHSRPAGLLMALAVFHQAKDNPHMRQEICETLLGKHGAKNISEVLETAGIKDSAAMEKLAKATIKNATSPVRNEAKTASKFAAKATSDEYNRGASETLKRPAPKTRVHSPH